MKAEGKKFPWGRKSGYAWKTPKMREREYQALFPVTQVLGMRTKSLRKNTRFRLGAVDILFAI